MLYPGKNQLPKRVGFFEYWKSKNHRAGKLKKLIDVYKKKWFIKATN